MTTSQISSRRQLAISQAGSSFDLIVVGGGCNGCAIAWDAALRGLRVLLVEKEDFGWATSAWNSRLIHGGLKYLEKYDVPLVRESLREREWMLQAAPHLVRPLRFVLPFYERNAHSAAVLRLGMVAYDVLSLRKSLPRHRVHDPQAALTLIPGLDTDGLQGASTYYDGQVEYAERLSVELALAAEAAGAVVLNHAQVDQVLIEDGAVTGVVFLDTTSGDRHTARAPAVVNSAGPWVDRVLGTIDENVGSPLMGGTKGTHLVVDPFPGAPVDSAMYYEAITDARPMMVIPWLGRYIIGATDVRFQGDLDSPTGDDDEIEYVLRETNLVLPGAGLTKEHILWSYTGVRPLPYQESGPTGDITRRHIIHDHQDDSRSVRGLFSVIGGKLTTFRSLAEHVNDEVLAKALPGRFFRTKRPATTRRARLPGARALDFEDFARRFVAASTLPPEVARRLVGLYGTRAVGVEALARSEPDLAQRIGGGTDVIAAEIAFALRTEWAVTLTDLVARRIMTGLDGTMGQESLQAVGSCAAALAGWSESRLGRETEAYVAYLARFDPVSHRAAVPRQV